MADLTDIISRWHATNTAIDETVKNLGSEMPSFGVQLSLESLQRRSERIMEEFHHQTNRNHTDVCRYRLIPAGGESYPICAVGEALSYFQKAISSIFDSIRNGVKQRTRISPEISAETCLNLATTFSGSLGFLLTIPSERLLGIKNDIEQSIDGFLGLVASKSSDQIAHFAKKFGPTSVRTVRAWLEPHLVAGFEVEIDWLRDGETLYRNYCGRGHLQNLMQAISETSDETDTTFTKRGTLVGADRSSNRFHMTFADSEEIRGIISDSFPVEKILKLPHTYSASIRKVSYINYAVEDEKTEYFLLDVTED